MRGLLPGPKAGKNRSATVLSWEPGQRAYASAGRSAASLATPYGEVGSVESLARTGSSPEVAGP